MEFNVLEWACGGATQAGDGWIPWEEIAVTEEEYDQADIISSAVYDRNLVIEEKYGVRITREYLSYDINYHEKLRNNNSTGDDQWQLITSRTRDIQPLIQESLLVDMKAEEYSDIFHFDQPWWVQDSIQSFALGDHLFVAASELLLRDKGTTAACFYNQKIAQDYGLDNLYDLVKNGQWTLEQMINMAEVVAGDHDGNDKIDSAEDMWGILGARDPVYYLFNSCGQKFGDINSEGKLEFTFGDSKSVTVVQDILNKVMFSEMYMNRYIKNDLKNIFVTDHALFSLDCVKTVLGLREMDSPYGILPLPKYDELQENYSSLVWLHADCVLGIPAVTADPEMSAIITEALSYESYYTVYPAFYDVVLMNRSTRDDESKEMLEIVFKTRSFDPGQYWTTESGLHSQAGLMDMTVTHSADVVSKLASYQSKIDACVKEINEWVDKH